MAHRRTKEKQLKKHQFKNGVGQSEGETGLERECNSIFKLSSIAMREHTTVMGYFLDMLPRTCGNVWNALKAPKPVENV